MMAKAIMDALTVSLFASQVLVHVLGRLTVIRESFYANRELWCISEDDGAALVWNDEISTESYKNANSARFHDANGAQSDEDGIDCKMERHEDCLKMWIGEQWNLTDSSVTPLGPVFDRRWEDFQEYGNFDMEYDRVSMGNTTVLSLSVRAFSDVQILFCNGDDYNRDFCYWILIGGWGNMKSALRRCPTGVPRPGQKADEECEIDRAVFDHAPLSSTEWRTFLVMWDIATRSISLYDPIYDAVFIKYKDTAEPPESREGFTAINSGACHMFIRSANAMIYRFHRYSFLHTTVADATLTSPTFRFNNTICIQLLLGLCAECEMDVALYDGTGSAELKGFLVNGSSRAASHGLPTWQSVTIKYSTDRHDSAIMRLTSKLDSHSSNSLWAIASVRQCPGNESIRKAVLKSQKTWYTWPSVTCQKLFYDRHTVVNTVADATPRVRLDEVCPEGRIGPRCCSYCRYNDCTRHVICYEEGCTCPAGFKGYECQTSCEANRYGYDCKETCGWCKSPTFSRVCNHVSGECINGCTYQQNQNIIYVPPSCKTGIYKPNPPTIAAVGKTSIKVKLPVEWKDAYKGSLFYSFIVSPNTNRSSTNWRQVYENMTELTEFFTNLEPGTVYSIACLFRVCNWYGQMCNDDVSSEWQTTETNCNLAEFTMQSTEHSLTIDWEKPEFPCPENSFRLTVYNTDANRPILTENINQFPHKLDSLPSYTLFTVAIFYKARQIFSQEIRTLEGVPSMVLNPKVQSIFDTNVTLSWTAPKQPHGIIEKYEATLQITNYAGCKTRKFHANGDKTVHRTRTTRITIENLHPYASYEAQIVAYNARYPSKPVEKSFETKQSEVATEVFSQLNVQGWNLMWQPPNDCTTITGSLYTRIKICGINDDAESFDIAKQTQLFNLPLVKANLLGTERYVARVYVIRRANAPENPSAYQEIEFIMPPGVPPRVTELDVYEIDDRQNPVVVHLRWQNPAAPLNGTLRGYGIRLCNKRRACSHDIEIPLDNNCDFYDDYVCGSVQAKGLKTKNAPLIEVVAYNMGVVEPGPPFVVPQEMLVGPTPEEPGDLTVQILNTGIVDLEWRHPWKTGRPLDHFFIMIHQLSTDLAKISERTRRKWNSSVAVTDYKRRYKKRLYLRPSTRYHVAIKAVTFANTSSKVAYTEFETSSSMMFKGQLELGHLMHDSTISLYVPPVINCTRNSIIHVIMKGPLGPNGCDGYLRVPEDLQALADVDVSHVAWEAAEISIEERDSNNPFMIGNSKLYRGAKNCPLQPKESYDITVIVTEGNRNSRVKPIALKITLNVNGEISRTLHEAWLVPVILILIASAVILHFYRRKKRTTIKKLMPQDEMALSQNIENYEHETKCVGSNSKESLSTPFNGQSLSRITTPEAPLTVIDDTGDAKEMTSLVKVKDFEDFVREAIQTGLLVKQYEIFPRGQTRPWDYGKLPENKSKNRYANLIAYDETRVILEKLAEDPYSDYINANYITGYNKEKHYIATQGPKPKTVIDFWRMIWQENVLIICMLANVIESGKTKCEQYWPDIGKKKKYGNVIVLNAKHNVFADYCFRTFHVTCGKETRKVEHLHYTAWPDHGVPLYTHSVVTYLKKLLATPPGNGSVVVHCSAGVGRTGTIILCDICLRRAAAEGVVDVFAETASIRSERANMVDNQQQYLLAHLALMECLLSIPTTLPCNEMLATRIKELKKQLPVQQQRLQNTAWQDEALRQIITSPAPLSERNRAKNRFPELIPDKIGRIYLTRYPTSDEDSDYLSAVYVDGVKLQNQYLATQLPMPSTINDFWRMTAEFKVELILMLQPPDPEDPTCCALAPASGEFKPTPYLNITAKETVELENYTSQKFVLVDNSEKPSTEQSVTVLCLTQWKPGRNQPPPPVMTMVTLWQAAERIARGDGPTVTLCHDGVTGCGLYLALSFLLERMAVERECDVSLAVRAVRRSRQDFVRSLEHLEYLYDAAVTYLEYFETYANFS